jgi:lipopolysaccharide transport system ATP-binding protein
MSRVEIRRKFDEIVAFSEVERFLDTPVKRYSSGMYVRLAFAVAAHLEPEILIVDEVLAVGDAQFQKKCLGKIQDVSANQGRTVLFVSHQIDSVTRLCQKALWLNHGKIHQFGPADAVCHSYLALDSIAGAKRSWVDQGKAPGNEWVRLEGVEASSEEGQVDGFPINKRIFVKATYTILQPGKTFIPNMHFYAEDGTLIFISHDWFSGWKNTPRPPGRYETCFTIPANFLSEGRVVVKLAISTYRPFQVHFEEPDVVAFTVVEAEEGETSRGDYAGHLPGIVRPILPIETRVL